MQKWEYLVIGYDRYNGKAYVTSINGESTFHTILGGSIMDAPEFYLYVAKAGEEGWELVSTNPWTFKRPKP